MNAKTRILIIALLTGGLLVLLLSQANQTIVPSVPATSMPVVKGSPEKHSATPSSVADTLVAQSANAGSPLPKTTIASVTLTPTLAQVYAIQTFAASTPAITPSPTSRPLSDAEVAIAISTSDTELQIGDSVTITVLVTNTGKLQIDQIGCTPYIYFEDGTEQRFSDRPKMLEASIPPGSFLFDKYVLPIGHSAVTSFTLRALNPGTASVKVSVSALTRYSPTEPESWMGNVSEAVTIYVYPSSH